MKFFIPNFETMLPINFFFQKLKLFLKIEISDGGNDQNSKTHKYTLQFITLEYFKTINKIIHRYFRNKNDYVMSVKFFQKILIQGVKPKKHVFSSYKIRN